MRGETRTGFFWKSFFISIRNFYICLNQKTNMQGKKPWAIRRQMFIWPKAGPIASIERFEDFVNSSFSCEIEYAGEAFKEKTGDVDVIFFLNPKDNDNILFTLFCESVGIERISLEWKFKGYSDTSVKRFFQ